MTKKETEFMVLGVSFDWGQRKGVDIFQQLAKELDERYAIVLVGTDDKIDSVLSKRIISVHRTHSQKELAEIYSSADVFVNPTREDNFPTVNIEALACGTPVITFDTGGSPEIIDGKCGSVVPVNDTITLLREIKRICERRPYKSSDCINRANSFAQNKRFEEYLNLY